MEFSKELSESEDDISILKRRNLVMVEFDSSPLEPKHMAEAERPGQNIEKLLLERVMLRKELRLRSVQETLVETSQKLDVMQDKVLSAGVVATLASWLGETAENVSNECRERREEGEVERRGRQRKKRRN